MGAQPDANLSHLALQSCREEYRDIVESWRSLDVKAQGLTAIAGIFLGGLFALMRNPPHQYGPFLRMVVVASILLLLTSFLGAILCLLVKPTKAAPSGNIVTDFTIRLRSITCPDERSKRVQIFYDDLFQRWKSANEDIGEAIFYKGICIRAAEIALLMAALLVGFIASETILRTGGLP